MKKLLFIFLVTLTASAVSSRLAAQGENNPTGVTGVYNGNVTTGCSYDPYTQNGLRVVDDIVVPGCVGAYPLKWTRYNNSRHEGVGYDGWSFSYAYGLDAAALIATFPDGRIISWWDSSPAVEEYIAYSNGYETIFLADGGKAVFNETVPGATNFLVTSVVDPYGNKTAISYDIVDHTPQGDPIYQRSRITEPGGRYLQLTWDSVLPVYNRHITGVQAFDGRGNLTQSVTYGGNAVALYNDGTSANYTYEIIGAKNSKRPALLTADDVRNSSPLRQIMYSHVGGLKGGIAWEKKLSGELLSSITYTGLSTRTEARGDGPTRTFTYGGSPGGVSNGATGKLINYTDFDGHTTTITYPTGFIGSVTDTNGHTTTYTRAQYSWGILRITHPDASHIDQTFTDDNNPYYLSSRTDELGHTTNYTRDANNRITRKDYPPDNSGVRPYETFDYNSFGQVTKHQLKNGAYQHFQYDARGLLLAKWNPTSNSTPVDGDPKTAFAYYPSGPWTDRVQTETDPRGNVTTYEHDYGFDAGGNSTGVAAAGRGVVTKITHADNTYQTFSYNRVRGQALGREREPPAHNLHL